MVKRITISLTDKQYEVLKGMSDSSGQPMSGFISDLIDGALPTMEQMSGAFVQIRRLQDQQKEEMKQSMERAQAAFGPLLDYMLENASIFVDKSSPSRTENLKSEERAIEDSSVSAKVVPPSTNRGGTNKATITKAKVRNTSKPKQGKDLRP